MDAILYTDNTAECPGVGTPEEPLCSIQAAIDAIGPDRVGTIRVRRGEGLGYVEDLAVAPGQTLALLADGAEVPAVNPVAGGSASLLTVAEPGSAVYLHGIRFRANIEGPAIDVAGATLVGSALEISQNEGGGILVREGANVTLVNTMIGDWDAYVRGIEVVNATFHGQNISVGYFIGMPAIACTATSTVSLSDSIVAHIDVDDDIACEGIVLDHVATRAEVGPPPNDFVWFQNHLSGDLHLRPEGAAVFADYGQWNTGDPATDIDGDPRPRVDGTPDFPGADVPLGM